MRRWWTIRPRRCAGCGAGGSEGGVAGGLRRRGDVNTVFCLAEDRDGAEIGLKLALLSLAEHCPGAPVVLHRPRPIPSFVRWVSRFPHVRLVADRPEGAEDWNCKPHALLPLLTGPDVQAVWVDSDLMLTRDVRPLFEGLSPGVLVATQEPVNQPHQGSEVRTRGWGLPVGRRLPFSVNTCLLRVTSAHRALLGRWRELLADPEYRRRQRGPIEERGIHLQSDQDVFAALLGSTGFADVPIHLLRHGLEVLHAGGALGFTLGERIRGLVHPVPTVLHAIAGKPWVLLGRPDARPPGWFFRMRELLQETSPYVAHARRYRTAVDEPTPWLDHHTFAGRMLRAAGLGHWAFRGLPITLVATAARQIAAARRGG